MTDRDQLRDAICEHLGAVLSAHNEYDQRLCCDGHMCGCQGSTVFSAIEHYFEKGLPTILASLDTEAVKAETIEQCAQKVERHPMRFAGQTEDAVRKGLAAAIRARKEQQP